MQMNKRKILQSIFDGNAEILKQLKADKLRASLPTVVILMPDGTLDVGDSKAFSDRYISKEEFYRVLKNFNYDGTVVILPFNGRDT